MTRHLGCSAHKPALAPLLTLVLWSLACGSPPSQSNSTAPTTPGNEGDWGLGATGGDASGRVVRITDLSRSALQTALADPTDRVVRYEGTLGNVELGGPFRVVGARNLTIEGAWVGFVGGTLVFEGAQNLVLRNLRVRNAVSFGTQNGDCIRLLDSRRVKLQAVSCAYGTDEGIDIIGGGDIVVVDSIVAETLWFSRHPESPGHSFCLRIGAIGDGSAATERILVVNTLLEGCSHRVPQVVRGATVYFARNTIYHYGGDTPRGPLGALCDGAAAIFESNNWIPGPESPASAATPIAIENRDGPCALFAVDNRFDGAPANQQDLVSRGELAATPPFIRPPLPMAAPAWGAQPHDPTDRALLANLASRTGTIGAKDRRESTPVPPPDTVPGSP